MNSMEMENATKFFEISEALYKADPADTCCTENGMTDEYDNESYIILDVFMKEKTISVERVKAIFNDRFDGYYSEDAIETVFPTIKRILNA